MYKKIEELKTQTKFNAQGNETSRISTTNRIVCDTSSTV